MYSINDILYVANILRINFENFSPDDLLSGMNIEREHGLISPETNVTNDDIIATAKIALAHLSEYPNYYNKRYGLQIFEEFLKTKMNDI